MTKPARTTARRRRGEIETLPSGSLRVKVYAGTDALTGRRHYLTEVVPAGPKAEGKAESARRRLVTEVDEQRNPRTRATVDQLMDRYLELVNVEETTRARYESSIRTHVRPLLGDIALTRLTGETLDSFYAVLRRCREHCDGRPFVVHHVADDDGPHECTERCRPHVCRPLATASIRKVHFCLSGALSRAVKWRWINNNPLDAAEPPRTVAPNPHPPSAAQAATILNTAFESDRWWGVLVWLAMTTGARRGELCALRWDGLDLDRAVLTIRTSIALSEDGKRSWEKDTKTHQQRRIALDETTVALLRTYRDECTETAASVGVELPGSGRLFSYAPDHSTWIKPSTVGQRYVRMCARLGWDMNIHELRHYSATELITAGVDVRTVAGRLGHGGGGSTTLRAYAAWISEADQRAAKIFSQSFPSPPISPLDGKLPSGHEGASRRSKAAHRRIADELRGAINCGTLEPGVKLPTIEELANRYSVVPSTVHRAITKLVHEGIVEVRRGKRAQVKRVSSVTRNTDTCGQEDTS